MSFDFGRGARMSRTPYRPSRGSSGAGLPWAAALVGFAVCGVLASAFLTGATGKKSVRPLSNVLGYKPRVRRSVTIDRSPDELFSFWQDPENFQRIIGHFADVKANGDDELEWHAPAPLGQWRMRRASPMPGAGKALRWEAADDKAPLKEVSVAFRRERSNRGTIVSIDMQLDPPGGIIGQAATRMMGNVVPGEIASKTLHYFKSLVLTGEIPTTDTQPAHRRDTH